MSGKTAMRPLRVAVLTFLSFSLTGWCNTAQAQDCKPLKRLASLPMKPISEGDAMLVPVIIEGTQRHLLFDTGGYMSQITGTVADELKMERRKSSIQLFDLSGNISSQYVIARQIQIDGMRASNVPLMIVSPDSKLGGGSEPYDGVLSSDLLFKYDIEADFDGGKLNYFSPDHCEGQVVYWPHGTVSVVPVKVFNSQIAVTVELDGRKISAIIDTGSPHSIISLNTAKYRFGITPQSPGVEPGGSVNGDEALRSYRYRFSKLFLGDIAIDNPGIDLLPDKVNSKNGRDMQTEWRAKRVDENLTMPDMLIGMDVLKQFRIYMALKERKFYLTARSAPAKPAPAAPAAAEARP
jgi:hypothetical protein